MAYWLFAEAMLQGRPIEVFNHGDMKRDFTYIDDVVQGVTAALFTEGLDQYELFNLGNNRPEPLMDLIRYLGDALGIEPQMEMYPMQPGDVPVTYADIGKAGAKLGYRPGTPLQGGLQQFVDWFRGYQTDTNV
jgi:UDP-glucuronate 4-epimerase